MSKTAEVNVKTGASAWLGDVLVSLSAANIALLEVWHQLIYRSKVNLYFLPNYTWPSYFSAIILLLLLSAVFLVALKKLRTADGIAVRFICAAVLFAYIPMAANALRLVFRWPIAWIINILEDPFNLAVVSLASVIALSVAWLLRRKLALLLYIVLMIFSPFALLSAAYSVWDGASLALEKEPVAVKKDHRDSSGSPHREKTILLIFDELDYRMAFERKVPGLDLKNLDYLKRNSLFFTDVKSIFGLTYQAIPSITAGRRVSPRPSLTHRQRLQCCSNEDDDVLEDDLKIILKDPDKSETTWRKIETIFSKLDKAGKNVAILGWYHPYCDVFGDRVDYCKQYSTSSAIEILPSNSLYKSLVKQMISLTPFYRVLNATDSYKGMRRDVLELITDDTTDFAYAHFQLPHFPHIYDRESGELTIFNVLGGYLDNLQLTDILLGEIISTLKENDLWDTSTLIVTADHHWRSSYLHDGIELKKVPLVVKLPMQDKTHISDAEMSMLQIKSLIEKIMLDKILDPVILAKEFETRTVDDEHTRTEQ